MSYRCFTQASRPRRRQAWKWDFIYTSTAYLTMVPGSGNQSVCSVAINPEDIFVVYCHLGSVLLELPTLRWWQKWWSFESRTVEQRTVTMLQDLTNLRMTDRHANDLPESWEDDELLGEKNGLPLMLSIAQETSDSTLIRKEDNTLKRLTDDVIHNATESFLKKATQNVTKRTLGLIYGAVEDIFNCVVNHGVSDYAISWRMDKFIKVQKFANNYSSWTHKYANMYCSYHSTGRKTWWNSCN